MELANGFDPITSSVPWNCSTIGAMQAKKNKKKNRVKNE